MKIESSRQVWQTDEWRLVFLELLTEPIKENVKNYLALLRPKDTLHDGEDIVWSPGQDEHQQDGWESLGRLPLLPLLLCRLLHLVLPWQRAGGQTGWLGHALHISEWKLLWESGLMLWLLSKCKYNNCPQLAEKTTVEKTISNEPYLAYTGGRGAYLQGKI